MNTVPEIITSLPEKPRAIGSAVWKVISSPWVRKPAYFVASVAAVTVGFGVVLVQALLSDERDRDEMDDVDFAERMEADVKRMRLRPSSLGVGLNRDSNRAHPGMYAVFNNELDRKYKERNG